MTQEALVLPAMCPLCGMLMQRSNTEGYTVAPHYATCHPGTPPPPVRNER